MTGIIGPNGCGKSNLTEALRWAMGDASPKGLRAEGMDDMIFAGAHGRPARAVAEVLIGVSRDGEPIEIARRIVRGGGSVYRLNGREVRAADIRLLLADAATGAHAAALVGQGRVAAIIAAKPAERRLMLEDAAGIGGLAVRRREAETRLRAAAANLERAADLVASLEAQAAALKRQARTAERYTALSSEIATLEARLLHARLRTAAATDVSARARARAAAEAVDAAAHAARSADAERDAAIEAAAHAGAAVAAARADHDRRSGERARIDAERAAAVRRAGELGDTARGLADDAAREAATLAETDAERATLLAEATAIEAAAAEREAASANAAVHARDADTALVGAEATTDEAAAARGAIRAAAAAADAAQLQAADLAARIARDVARIARERAALTSLPTSVANPDVDPVAHAAATRADADEALAQADAARGAAVARRDRAEADHALAASAHAAARADHARLAAEVAAARTAVAASADAGVIALIEVAPGLENALAAALGDDLAAAAGKPGEGWARIADGAADPRLPDGAEPLDLYVIAPTELARRLAQIGVVDDDAIARRLAPHLAPGQRIVTRDGGLWRWDGFEVERPGAMRAAKQLRTAHRLAALAVVLPPAAHALAAATTAATAAAVARDAAAADVAAASAARATALCAADDAARHVVHARAKAERHAEAARAARAGHATAAAGLAAAEARLAVDRAILDDFETTARARALDPQALAHAEAAVDAARRQLAAARAHRDAAAAARLAADAAGADAIRRAAAITAALSAASARSTAATDRSVAIAARIAATEVERASVDARPASLAEAAAAATDALNVSAALLADADATERADRARLATIAARCADAAETLATAREARAVTDVEARHAADHSTAVARLAAEHPDPPADDTPEAAIEALFARAVAERERIGAVNLLAARELAEIRLRLETLERERDEIDGAISRLRGQIGALNREGRARLATTFAAVDARFQALFATLFGGGEARLTLVEADDPLDAGLEILARPPGKTAQSLALLSGGEQALTAIALIFALFLINPSPICVLDEVDAPLDDANVDRFCDLLATVSAATPTRFLVVTHNPVTMARLDRLWGVTMAEPGISQLVHVDLAAAEALVASG